MSCGVVLQSLMSVKQLNCPHSVCAQHFCHSLPLSYYNILRHWGGMCWLVRILSSIQFHCFVTQFIILDKTPQLFFIHRLLLWSYPAQHGVHDGGRCRHGVGYVLTVPEIWQTAVSTHWCCVQLSCSNVIQTFYHVFRCHSAAAAATFPLYTLQSCFCNIHTTRTLA